MRCALAVTLGKPRSTVLLEYIALAPKCTRHQHPLLITLRRRQRCTQHMHLSKSTLRLRRQCTLFLPLSLSSFLLRFVMFAAPAHVTPAPVGEYMVSLRSLGA